MNFKVQILIFFQSIKVQNFQFVTVLLDTTFTMQCFSQHELSAFRIFGSSKGNNCWRLDPNQHLETNKAESRGEEGGKNFTSLEPLEQKPKLQFKALDKCFACFRTVSISQMGNKNRWLEKKIGLKVTWLMEKIDSIQMNANDAQPQNDPFQLPLLVAA